VSRDITKKLESHPESVLSNLWELAAEYHDDMEDDTYLLLTTERI
jgi:hypothetical protein